MGDRQELLGRPPSRRWRRLSNTTTAPLLPAISSSECRAVPAPIGTSQLRLSWHGPSEFAPLPDPGRSAVRVLVDNRCAPPRRCPSRFVDHRAGIAVLPIRLPRPAGSVAALQLVIARSPDLQSFLDLPVHSRYSCSQWRISFGCFEVLSQQINQIRRFFSIPQTPDSVITPPTQIGSLPNVASAIFHDVGGGNGGVRCTQLASVCFAQLNLTVPSRSWLARWLLYLMTVIFWGPKTPWQRIPEKGVKIASAIKAK